MYNIERALDNNFYIKINKDELNLNKTLDCGQAFRWKQLDSNWWQGVIGNEIICLGQGTIDNEECIVTNASDLTKIVKYLNIDMNYTELIESIALNTYESKAYEYSKGIHILRQDLFETMVTFLMSQCNTMHNIKIIVRNICTDFGEKIETEFMGRKFTDFAFPSLDKLSECSVDDFKKCRMGFRADFLYDMIKDIKNTPKLLDDIANANYNESIYLLKQFNGIGDKVANCISLFGLHHVEAFPIDTHMRQIINREYNGNIDIQRYKGIAGIIQQYMFYYEAFN